MPDGCSKLAKCSEETRCSGKECSRERALNGMPAKTGATHNFVSKVEAKRLGLKFEKDVGRMKAVNSKALATTGLAK